MEPLLVRLRGWLLLMQCLKSACHFWKYLTNNYGPDWGYSLPALCANKWQSSKAQQVSLMAKQGGSKEKRGLEHPSWQKGIWLAFQVWAEAAVGSRSRLRGSQASPLGQVVGLDSRPFPNILAIEWWRSKSRCEGCDDDVDEELSAKQQNSSTYS
jgi:hypothetical protein